MDASNPLLMIMARAPERGGVKTRLEGSFGTEAALSLHVAMVEDTLELARRSAGAFRELVVCWTSATGESPPSDWGRRHRGFRHVTQGEGSLGERLARAFERELVSGAVICIGTDSPTLPDEYLMRAAQVVGHGGPKAVFGPARDGGYYLVGLSTLAPYLFEGIDWGTAGVLAQSLRQAANNGLDVSLLPPWYDIDRPDDVRSIARRSNPDARRGPRTAEVGRSVIDGKPPWTKQKPRL